MVCDQLNTLALQRGQGQIYHNLETVLNFLWSVSETHGNTVVVQRAAFEGYLRQLRKYFHLLNECGCIEMVIKSAPGKPLVKLRLFRRDVPYREGDPRKQDEGGPIITPPTGTQSRVTTNLPTPAIRKPRAVANSTEEHTYIFVDVPNLVTEDYVALSRINWAALMGMLAHRNGKHRTVKGAFAYLFLPSYVIDPKNWPVYRDLEAAGFVVEYRKEKRDIDVWLITDLLDPRRIQYSNGMGRITLFLVSGDRDYMRALLQLKDRFQRRGVSLDVHIVSWKNSLSTPLSQFADEVIYIEDIHRFIDYSGFHRLQQDNIVMQGIRGGA